MQATPTFGGCFPVPTESSAQAGKTDGTAAGNLPFRGYLFPFGGSSSTTAPESDAVHDGAHAPSSFQFLDKLEDSASAVSGSATATHAREKSAPSGLEDMFSKFSAGPNAEGSSGFLSESAGTTTTLTTAMPLIPRSEKGSPMQSALPLSPCSCASSQQHPFPSVTPSPSVQAYNGTPPNSTSPLGTHPTLLTPRAGDLPLPGGYGMNNMFVPLMVPNTAATAAAASTAPPSSTASTAPLMSPDVRAEHTFKGTFSPPATIPAPPSITNTLVRRNVYVSGLPAHFRSNDLRELCQPFGRIEASKLCVDSTTNPTKGYGFALFFDEMSAAACIVGLNGRQVCGRTLQARYADVAATPKPAAPFTPASVANNNNNTNSSVTPPRNAARSGANNNNNNGRRSHQQQQHAGQSTPPSQASTPTVVPSPMLYTSIGAPAMPGNVMWLPAQAPTTIAQPAQQYVMLPQGPVPVMMNGGLATAPAPTQFVYVMDPVTQQVQLCQYPTYMTTATTMDVNGAPVQLLPTHQMA